MAAKKKAIRFPRNPLSRRRRNGIQFLAILIVLLVVAGSRLISSKPRQSQTATPPASSKTDDSQRFDKKMFCVTKAIDGDTLDLQVPDGEKPYTRVRLWGVDTPETRHPTIGVMYFGPEASAFTREMVQGKDVMVCLEPDEHSRDKYGRLLAYIYLPDGHMLNQEIIEQGYGYADSRFRHLYRERFEELEKLARQNQKGLWKNVKPDQFPAWRKKKEAKN